VQAQTYPNPILGYTMLPTADNSSANFQSGFIDQVIVTGGKLKLSAAAAQQDLNNAELALKRARSDLSTAVRRAYFTLLVDVEALAVTRALSRFTDDVYRMQTGLLGGAQAAPYEPATLRAQAYETRLAYKQAIASYSYDWKTLVATIGMEQLPLSALAGRVDRLVPCYDYDALLAYALQNHTDVLTARNLLRKAQYNLKFAQILKLVPDVDVHMPFGKDFSFAPPAIAPGTFGTFNFFSFGFAPPVWDQNTGSIIASQGGVIFAAEGVHFAEVNLATNLAAAYANYRNNLYAIEAYRRNILPDLTRYYRGVFERRQVDPKSSFNDLVTAQQTLSANVASYLGVLQALWQSVVSVADFLQTDDLFQLAVPRALLEMPDLHQLPLWPCDHPDFTDAPGPRTPRVLHNEGRDCS
jgi:cobalt-zinc-cadmium efflux system outer membrane protein